MEQEIEWLDIAEISKEVFEGSHYFAKFNDQFYNDPRAHIYIEDAKTFMQLSPRKYDIIISEPSNPWVTGVGNLYTQEFFLDVRDHLAPNGIFTQWFHSYEMSDDTAASILRTITSIFEYVSIWLVKGNDVILVASATPITMDFEKLAERIAEPKIKQELAKVQIYDVPSLLVHQVSSPVGTKKLVTPGPLNRDTFPYLEYNAPKDFFYKAKSYLFLDFDEKTTDLTQHRIFLAQYLAHYPLTEQNFANLCTTMDYEGYEDSLKASIIEAWKIAYPQSTNQMQRPSNKQTDFSQDIQKVNAQKVIALQNPDRETSLYPYIESFFYTYSKFRSLFYKVDPTEWLSISSNALPYLVDKQNKTLRMRSLVFEKESMPNPDTNQYTSDQQLQ